MKLGPDRINESFYIINTWHIKPLSSLSQIVKFSVIVCLKHMIATEKKLPITTAKHRLQGMNYS